MSETRPPEWMVLALMDDSKETRPMCPSRRMNNKGYWVARCTWLAGHSGSTHHDAHTSATWKDKQ